MSLGSKRKVALLFFDTSQDASEVQKTGSSYGAKIARLEGTKAVLVFDGEDSDNPTWEAARAAQTLVERAVCRSALVDLAMVTRVEGRTTGRVTYSAPVLRDADRFPRSEDPAGVLLTSEASAALPDLVTTSVQNRPWVSWRFIEAANERAMAPTTANAATLIGRESLVTALWNDAEQTARERSPALFTVIAEPGHGKSLLAQHTRLRLAARPDAVLMSFEGKEHERGISYRLTPELLRWLLDLPATAPIDRGRALLKERLPRSVPPEAWAVVALELEWISPEAPEVQTLGVAPGVLRNLTTRILCEGLRKKATSRPLWILVDDAHLADDIALDALELATAGEGCALWVCVLTQPSFPRPLNLWGSHAHRHTSVTLGPLDFESATHLVQLLLLPAENISSDAVKRMIARSRGVPLLIHELIRGLKSKGIIRQEKRGGFWYLAADELDKEMDSPLVDWLANRELAALPPEIRAHACLAALLGGEFTEEEFQGILKTLPVENPDDAPPLEAQQGLAQLKACEVLVADGPKLFRFRTPLMREAIASTVESAQRKRIHQAAYRYLEAQPVSSEAQRARLAFHAEYGGLVEQAAALNLELARLAQVRHHYVEAESRYSRALSVLPESDRERFLEAYRGRGLMRYRTSRYQDSISDFAKAKALAQTLGRSDLVAEILLDESTALDWMLEFRRSKELVEEARAQITSTPPPLLEARLVAGEARSLMRFGDYAAASAKFDEVLTAARPLGDDGYETVVIALLLNAALTAFLNRLDDAQRMFVEVETLCEARSDRLHLSAALQNRMALHLAKHDAGGIIDACRRVLAVSKELGGLSSIWSANFNLAEAYYWIGDIDSVWPYLARATALQIRLMGPDARPSAQLLKARVLGYQGDLAAANVAVAQLVEHQRDATARGKTEAIFLPEDALLLRMAQLACQPGYEPASWESLIDEAQAQPVHAYPVEVIEMAALSAWRAKVPDEANALLDRALKLAAEMPNIMERRLRALKTQWSKR